MEQKLFRLKRIRSQIRLFLPALFLVISLIFIVLGVSDNPALNRTRKVVMEAMIPVVKVVRAPVFWLKSGAVKIKNWSLTYSENETLKQENQELLKWQALAFEYQTQLSELRHQLNYVFPKKSQQLLADILWDEGSNFSRSYIVEAGLKEGVKNGMLAFGRKALVGRIVEVGEHSSRLMELTDYMSRIPVWVGKDKLPGFLIGDNTDMPTLQMLKSDVKLNVNDEVVTSGYAGVYPANLMIGFVKTIDEDVFRVNLMDNSQNLSVVRLVDYGLTKKVLLDEK